MRPKIFKACLIVGATFVLFAQSTLAKEGLSNESEAGIAISSGNTRTQSYNLKQINAFGFGYNTVSFNGRYFRTQSGSLETARQWSLGLRFERALTERFSLFAAQTMDSNKFAGYLLRHSTDIGSKFWLVKETDLTWLAEGGYRFTRENVNTQTAFDKHYGRAYSEAEKGWTPNFSTKLWLEYLHNFAVSQDFQLNSELSASAVLSEIFSAKIALLINFDNVKNPGVAEHLDSLFTTALVAKF